MASADTFGKLGQKASRSKAKVTQRLSDDILDLVETISGYRDSRHIAIMEDILDNVPRAQWDEALQKRLKVNVGMAKALFLFLKQC
jgi:hypothetical protein